MTPVKPSARPKPVVIWRGGEKDAALPKISDPQAAREESCTAARAEPSAVMLAPS